MLVVAQMQQLYNVVNLDGPDMRKVLTGDDFAAYQVRTIQMYYVFMQTIDTIEQGARLLRTHFQTKNARQVYIGLREYYKYSTVGQYSRTTLIGELDLH